MKPVDLSTAQKLGRRKYEPVDHGAFSDFLCVRVSAALPSFSRTHNSLPAN